MKKSAKRMFEKFTDLFSGVFKIQALTYYLKGIGRVRRFCLLLFSIFFATATLVGGLILVHAALFLYVPWSPKAKLLALLILGAVYALVSAGFLISQFSQKKWMEFSKAGELMEDVIDKK